MNKIQKIVAGAAIVLSTLLPKYATSQEAIDNTPAPTKDITLSVTQNNGYYIPYGPKFGGDIGTQFTLSKGGAFVWGAYDPKNKTFQEIDIGYVANILSRSSANEKTSFTMDGEADLWFYPPKSTCGATPDFVLKLINTLSTSEIFGENNRTSLKAGFYHLADNNNTKNGSAYDFEIRQQIGMKPVNLNIYANTIYGKGLYGFQGCLNRRVGINIEKNLGDLTLSADIIYQNKGLKQNNNTETNNAWIFGVTAKYNFASQKKH